ncbi:MAG: trypsin-like peptidase domain-containing protein [Lachnospira sp.]|nr:trypsin-like peptidase domain-containing protein [Lachnospira sp.]
MDKQNEPQDELQNEVDLEFQQESEFSFIQETIKDENPTPKTNRRRLLYMAVLGIVFGLCTGIGFSAIKPWAERTFQSNKTKVTIPEDKEEPEEEAEPKEEESVGVVTEENMQQVYDQLSKIGNGTKKSLAVITRKVEGADWTDNDPSNEKSGLIVANNGQELLILVSASIQDKAESYTATFSDGNTYDATMKVADEHFGYSIMAVPISGVRSSTKNRLDVATLGNSNTVKTGDVVIALGSQFGHKDDMGFGVVSSIQNTINTVDGSYNLITTDIPCGDDSAGVLINQQGEVVGLMNGTISKEGNDNISNAYAISRVKSMIEMLSNGNQVPYVGIQGNDVTEEVSQEQGIPVGVYVTEVGKDSAALAAGVKSGDVFTSVNGESVTNLKGYHNALMQYHVGDKVKIEGQRLGSDGYVDITFTVTLAQK